MLQTGTSTEADTIPVCSIHGTSLEWSFSENDRSTYADMHFENEENHVFAMYVMAAAKSRVSANDIKEFRKIVFFRNFFFLEELIKIKLFCVCNFFVTARETLLSENIEGALRKNTIK